jgi:hypothetical protein
MALRPGPLPGYYVEAVTGIAQDVTAQNPTPDGNERCYIKDCIAAWLNLPIAAPRVGRFNNTNNTAQTNGGRDFAIRGQRGSYTYKVLLIPLTPIPVHYYDSSTGTTREELIQRNSFSISLSRTIGVAELRSWLITGTGANELGTLKGESVARIMGLVTPWHRKYIWRTPLLGAPGIGAEQAAVHTSVNTGAGAAAPAPGPAPDGGG